MLMMSINNHLMLQNIINANLDELDENTLIAENEDLDELT